MKSCEEMVQSLFARREAYEAARKKRRKTVKRGLTGVVSVCLTAAVCMGFWYTVNGQTQAAARVWKREIRGNRSIYSAGYELPDITMPEYELTWIPEGYQQVHSLPTDGEEDRYAYSESYYHTEEDDYFFWNVKFLGAHKASVQLSENRTVERLRINGMEGDLYHSDYPEYGFEISELFWFDNELGIMFQLSGNLTKEEIIAVAESMVVVKETP